MEEKKKKKMTFGKKLKRSLKRIIRGIVKFCINAKNKFMSLPKKLRYIIYVWAVVLLVVLILIIGSNRTSKSLDKYHEMEKQLKEAAYSYVYNNEFYPNVGKKMRIDMDLLIDQNYLNSDYVTDKTCRGYGLVYYDEEDSDYVVNSYINCKHYTTKNFAMDFEQ